MSEAKQFYQLLLEHSDSELPNLYSALCLKETSTGSWTEFINFLINNVSDMTGKGLLLKAKTLDDVKVVLVNHT